MGLRKQIFEKKRIKRKALGSFRVSLSRDRFERQLEEEEEEEDDDAGSKDLVPCPRLHRRAVRCLRDNDQR